MSAEEKPARRLVRKNYEFLINELRVSNYLDALYEEELLTSQDNASLRSEQNECKQAREFVNILLKKPEETIEKFFEIVKMRKDAQPHIYRKLFQCLEQQGGQASGSQQEVLPKSSEFKDPACLTAMVPRTSLRPTLILDDLRLFSLVSQEE